VPERGTADKAELSFVVPAPAETWHWLLDGPSDLRRAAAQRGRAGCLAARESWLAETGLASDHGRTDRLTLELSGHINREAIDWSA
jgi:hypothetical protein